MSESRPLVEQKAAADATAPGVSISQVERGQESGAATQQCHPLSRVFEYSIASKCSRTGYEMV